MGSILEEKDNDIVSETTENDISISVEGSVATIDDEKNKLKEKAEQNKIIKEQLKKQIQSCSNSEAFNTFTKTQKKQSKKKVIITSIVCILIIGFSVGSIYFKFFARNNILRGTDLDMTYDEVMQREKYMYDSKNPESFGDIMLCYSGVKYKKLKGDAFYFFDSPKGKMYVMSMKFEYSKEIYDYLLNSLSKEFGSYTMGEYNATYPNSAMWKKDDKQISILVSEENKILDVVIEYS